MEAAQLDRIGDETSPVTSCPCSSAASPTSNQKLGTLPLSFGNTVELLPDYEVDRGDAARGRAAEHHVHAVLHLGLGTT